MTLYARKRAPVSLLAQWVDLIADRRERTMAGAEVYRETGPVDRWWPAGRRRREWSPSERAAALRDLAALGVDRAPAPVEIVDHYPPAAEAPYTFEGE